jgi:hypothetical protein
MRKGFLLSFLLTLPILFLFSQTSRPDTADRQPVIEALSFVRSLPTADREFDYIMTARVRLLLFWVGKDDVGGGYVRRGYSPEDPHQEIFQVLFGSDPAKAPRAINRWGAGTEIVWHRNSAVPSVKDKSKDKDDVVSSVFYGFMKSSRGKSVSEMQEELKKEKDGGEHLFSGILSRAEPGKAVSLIVPMSSPQDYNLHDYQKASSLMLEKMMVSDRVPRISSDSASCSRASEFLGSVAELLEGALNGAKSPASVCYVYDAKVHTLTLEHTEAVPTLPVKLHAAHGVVLQEANYDHLLQADFSSTQKDGKPSSFTILVGTQGDLRGVPVQIRYQPNWWFEVVLNLEAGNSSGVTQTANAAAK